MSGQSHLGLLDEPLAKELLGSREVARVAYTAADGTPRVVPLWFHWDGRAIVIGSTVKAGKVGALTRNPDVAVTIDDASAWPYKALLIRGRATVDITDGPPPEYAAAARRYLGEEAGGEWVGGLGGGPMARIAIEPTWVSLLDFVTRFPQALSA